MVIDWTTVPGYTVALQNQRDRRELSYLIDETELCGERVYQLTPWHHIALEAAGNPFVVGGSVSPESVLQFLWVVSVHYNAEAIDHRNALIDRAKILIYDDAVQAIDKYVRDANRDAPGSSGSGESESISWIASLVHIIASTYGWSESEIIRIPFVRLWQYVRCLRVQHGDNVAFVNEVDHVKSAHLRELINGN